MPHGLLRSRHREFLWLSNARDTKNVDRDLVIAEKVLNGLQLLRVVINEQPMYFFDLSEKFADRGFPALSRAIGRLHENGELWQDRLGRLCLVGSEFAAELD